MKNIFGSKRGFTIAELLVSMGIFIVVISVSTTIFIKALKAQRAIVAYAEVNDSLQLSVEQMAREIRTGQNFRITGGGKRLLFESAQEGQFLPITPLSGFADVWYEVKAGSISRKSFGPPVGEAIDIISNKIEIVDVQFILKSDTSGPPELVTIIIKAKPKDDTLQGNYEITIQTSVSPRGISL